MSREENNDINKTILSSLGQIGFDVMAIGEEELNLSEDNLEWMQEQIQIPLLGLNLNQFSGDFDSIFLVAFSVLTRGDLKKSVIGCQCKEIES